MGDVFPGGFFVWGGGFFFVCVGFFFFSNFDKSSSITKVPVPAVGADGGAELLSCELLSPPLSPSPQPWQGPLDGDCPPCPHWLSPLSLSCAVAPPGGAAPPRWGRGTAGTLHRGWGQLGGPAPVPEPCSCLAAPCMDEAGPRPQQKTPACATPQPPTLSRALPRAPARASPSQGEPWGFLLPPLPRHAGSQGRRSLQRRCGRSLLAMETLLARSLSFPTLIFSSGRSFSR